MAATWLRGLPEDSARPERLSRGLPLGLALPVHAQSALSTPLRAKKRHGETPLEESWEGEPARRPGQETLEACPALFSLEHCLGRLCADKRNAIVLAYRHGPEPPGDSHHTQTPLGTVKS